MDAPRCGPRPAENQAAPPRPAKHHCCSATPRPAKYHCCPAPPHGSGQNCGAFAGQNENHTLNSINGDDWMQPTSISLTLNVGRHLAAAAFPSIFTQTTMFLEPNPLYVFRQKWAKYSVFLPSLVSGQTLRSKYIYNMNLWVCPRIDQYERVLLNYERGGVSLARGAGRIYFHANLELNIILMQLKAAQTALI